MIGLLQEDFSLTGGVEAVTKRLVESFLRAGKEIKVYSCKQKNIKKKEGYEVNVLGITSFRKKEAEKFASLLRHDNVSDLIVQLNGPYSIMANRKLLKKLYAAEINIFVVIHNSPKAFITVYNNPVESNIIHLIKQIRMKLYLKRRNKKLFSYINKYVNFVTISQGNHDELKKYYGIESFIIPNFWDVSDSLPVNFKKIHSLAFIGRFDFCQKNILFLLDAWNCVENKGDWFFTILGDDDVQSQEIIKKYVRQHNISNVIVKGVFTRDKIKSFLSTNSILLLGSNYEGFPTVVLEAGVHRNVIISTKYDGFSEEILKNNINCYVVDFDVHKFSNSIQYVISNEQVYEKFQKETEFIVNKYLQQDVLKQWDNIFNRSCKL